MSLFNPDERSFAEMLQRYGSIYLSATVTCSERVFAFACSAIPNDMRIKITNIVLFVYYADRLLGRSIRSLYANDTFSYYYFLIIYKTRLLSFVIKICYKVYVLSYKV